ncbi:MAG: cyclic pyranopterin monophosphate synthase MoaC [Cytophagales bacterium]|jgi:cyclic pyranopterin phosphate synthase|nr:cyclic pyranopterin monophosphate synthase MoaC [Cytophagales bacterium]MCA6389027.1 cyclic pyranopterin monophosphate synthase MoaC [Cytophagales bacterium]MCA6392852.1 cyclic pyranopterin monophosphate synthase MoaC [Cytophagales bacterium]MCA6394445.1 cyclic pyranopterin monophosphate synthase MoaC [Cytophagales bacterium]MCA6397206.1 cyclic pyranopterin monophosphate synthase MoaC [Cytophagales bacterium]
MKNKFTHIHASGNPQMVDVSDKKVTHRVAKAQAVVFLGEEIMSQLQGDELITKKGPVFQTAIIAGVMGAKKTSELIPFCHPLGLEDVQIIITPDKETVIINATTRVTGKTGVEMEALTAVSIAALTVYDMCKALSHEIQIKEIKLMEKAGGKKNFKRK